MDHVTSLTQDEMESVNGGSSPFWNDFWDGVLKDLQDMADGFHDAVK
ncbi:MAG TPA: hypothetical protein VFE05_17915 [Longimicrobiaceae bacterium]|jgi:hypothetical protein|nr:hypothetical protein [Longimicrobiaceae bacterium]